MKTENMNSLVPKRGGLGTRPAATCQRLSKSMMDDSNEPEELHEQEIGDAESEGAGDESEGELSSDHGEEGEKEEEEKKGKGRKRKRKGSTHHRRKLRSKYESVEDFNLEARTAQSEELERIRRLKLQQTLTGEEGCEESEKEKEEVEGKRLEGNGRSEEGQAGRREREGSGSPKVMVVDLTEVVEGDQGPSKGIEPIVIDSGSDSEDERSSAPSKKPHSASAQRQVLNKKYDWATPCADGKILVNVGHGPEEEDIFLSPQIAKAAKPHQVRWGGACALSQAYWDVHACRWSRETASYPGQGDSLIPRAGRQPRTQGRETASYPGQGDSLIPRAGRQPRTQGRETASYPGYSEEDNTTCSSSQWPVHESLGGR